MRFAIQSHPRHEKVPISLPINWTSTILYYNFVIFCLLYAVVHAAVDAVVAFSTAELGPKAGSIGGFALYASYTCSALLVAKPTLCRIGPKNAMQTGLTCLLCYVASFLLSLLHKKYSTIVFTMGSVIGGIGAGLLWSAQGSYFALNAGYYTMRSGSDRADSLTTFASIFATSLLLLEFIIKTAATAMYISAQSSRAKWPWREVVFGTYTAMALCSVVLFWYLVLPLDSAMVDMGDHTINSIGSVEMQARSTHGLMTLQTGDSSEDSDVEDKPAAVQSTSSSAGCLYTPAVTSGLHSSEEEDNPAAAYPAQELASGSVSVVHMDATSQPPGPNDLTDYMVSDRLSNHSPISDIYSVTHMLLTNRTMQLMLPYQLCFGFSAGLVNSYILGVVVKAHLQDGYIGMLSGVTALTAGALSMPFAYLANHYARGRWAVMVFGAVCFAFAGAAMICMSDTVLSTWPWIVTFFIIHGAARGVWESSNKAVIALFFPEEESQQVAFAAVYFASGLSGALGFLLSGLAPRESIAALNLTISLLALVCYHFTS